MIQQLHKETLRCSYHRAIRVYNKIKIAWSPSSSCATGEHAADRLVTLSYLSYRQNLQHETLQPQRVNTLELYWQDITTMRSNFSILAWLSGVAEKQSQILSYLSNQYFNFCKGIKLLTPRGYMSVGQAQSPYHANLHSTIIHVSKLGSMPLPCQSSFHHRTCQ
jgi:hypothetical protein